MSNLFLSALGVSAGMGGPLEDVFNIMSIKETGNIGDIQQAVTRGQESTKIGAIAELVFDLCTNVLPFHLKLPIAGLRSAIEFCRGDIGDALSSLMLVVPFLGKIPTTKLSSVLDKYDNGVKRIVKTASKDGFKAAVSEFAKDSGSAAREVRKLVVDPFLTSYRPATI
jgi:hypothetical protein